MGSGRRRAAAWVSPAEVVAARCSWPNVQVRDVAAVEHARRAWDLALRVALSAAPELVRQVGLDRLGTAGRALLAGQADLVFVGELGTHLAECGRCYREHADGGVPAEILRAAVRLRPMWSVYRPVELEVAERRRQRGRRGKVGTPGWILAKPA